MNITIIGSGYVGLVTGACFAELGNTVICVDNDISKIEKLEKGLIPFYEPGLEPLVTANVKQGRLLFSSSIKESVQSAEMIFICVGTPPLPNGEADLRYVARVMKDIIPSLQNYALIVEKSTVPVRTSEWLTGLVKENVDSPCEFEVASNPEFLSEGTAVHDFMNPDRIVLGVNSEKAASLLIKLYAPLNAPILVTDINSAELIKHASNAFLAMKISFINSIANICEKTGADINKVAKGIGLDKRIGHSFFRAGVGYGGICLPKDVSAFIQIASKCGYDFQILKAVREVNDNQKLLLVMKTLDALDKDVANKTIGILGLAFKPNTDDMREAPSIYVINELQKLGAKIKAYDPVAMNTARQIFSGDIEYTKDIYETADGVDALIILTEWEAFKYLDIYKLKKIMKQPVIIDGRNIYEPAKMKDLGIQYFSFGRD